EYDFACRKQIPNADCRSHGDTDQQSGRNLADTRIMDDSPYSKVEQRNAADKDCYPCRVKWEKRKFHRLASEFLHQMWNQVKQQEHTGNNCHWNSSQKIIQFL